MIEPRPPRHLRVVLVAGTVSSSLGKGLANASLGALLRARGLRVAVAKLDPYLNTDPGTMNPGEHGETFVTADGAEADLDLGHYERFIDIDLTAAASVTSGKVYSEVLAAERRGDYLGHTVQMVPHVVSEIMARTYAAATEDTDVLLVELGGTVGDMEVAPYLEAFRRIREAMPGRCALVALTLVPEVGPNRELKTKPAQHAVTLVRSHGLIPDILLARAARPLGDRELTKLSRLCGIPRDRVLSVEDVSSIYALPDLLHRRGFDTEITTILGLDTSPPELTSWRRAVANLVDPPAETVKVALVAKYTTGADTYISVCEALSHAAAALDRSVELVWVDAESDPDEITAALARVDALVVPGGFGTRGIDGKIAAVAYARNQGLPFLGLCLGLQVAVVEHARHRAGIVDATSSEWGSAGTPVVTILDEQHQVTELGGTMRLGAYPARLTPGTRVAAAYGLSGGGTVTERHRHRYEVNPELRPRLEAAGLIVSGSSPDGALVEFVELTDHPFFVATQAHPELTSRPQRPHPLFRALIAAARH